MKQITNESSFEEYKTHLINEYKQWYANIRDVLSTSYDVFKSGKGNPFSAFTILGLTSLPRTVFLVTLSIISLMRTTLVDGMGMPLAIAKNLLNYPHNAGPLQPVTNSTPSVPNTEKQESTENSVKKKTPSSSTQLIHGKIGQPSVHPHPHHKVVGHKKLNKKHAKRNSNRPLSLAKTSSETKHTHEATHKPMSRSYG